MSSSSDDDDYSEDQSFVLSEERKEVKNLDEFITLGWYCTFVLIAGEFMTLTALSSVVYMVYAGINPTVTGCGSIQFSTTKEACESLNALRAAANCTPVINFQFSSVNVEFDLLCEDGKLVKNCISLQMVCVLVGALISGQLSDRYGRRKVLIVSLLGVCLFSFGTALSVTFFHFTVLRAATGFFTGGLTAVQGVFLIENLPKRHRMWINTIVTWSPNFIIYPIVAYYCHNWRNLAFFTAFMSLISVTNMCFLHESPRWLIHHGHIEEARRMLSNLRRLNRDTREKEANEIEEMLRHEQHVFDARQNKRSSYTFYHLVCTWRYLRWTSTVCYGLVISSLINYGLLFNMEKLSGSLYFNNTLFGVLRWSVSILVGVSDYFFRCVGRKLINFVAISFIIIALAVICAISIRGEQHEYAWAIQYCTISVTSVTSQLYTAKFMIMNELFPTAIRNIAVSALSVSSRVGTTITPQLFYLADIEPALPYFVLLVVAVIDCICFQIFLPETKGKSLENSLPPKEHRILYRKHSVWDE